MTAAKIGLKLLNLDENTFSETEKAAKSKPELVEKMQKDDDQNRAEIDDPAANVIQSKVELKMIWLERIKQTSEIEKRIAMIMSTTQQERQMIAVIEQMKLNDSIFLKYGLKLEDLIREVKKQGLESDPDVKALSE